jgi:hypothetical protein
MDKNTNPMSLQKSAMNFNTFLAGSGDIEDVLSMASWERLAKYPDPYDLQGSYVNTIQII